MCQRTTQSAPPETFHTEGEKNILADVASRAIRELEHLPVVSNLIAFLAYFNSRFPLPQSPSWTLATPDSILSSNVISTLRGQRVATVDDKEGKKSWENWQRYTAASNRPPTLHGLDKSKRQSLLLAFAAGVCTGL
jgi:hypothetical protein